MMRIGILLVSLVVTACDVGDVGTSNNNNTADGGGMTADFNACVDRRTPADVPHKHTDDQTSHKGQNCIAANCHLNSSLGALAPGYQFAGTLYAIGGTMPQAGAAVRIKSGTTVLTAYADADGNFFFPAGSIMGSFSANTNVSGCPSMTSMVGLLVGGSGAGGANSCNLCHTTGANAMAPPISF
jgi:hypothetical protein